MGVGFRRTSHLSGRKCRFSVRSVVAGRAHALAADAVLGAIWPQGQRESIWWYQRTV